MDDVKRRVLDLIEQDRFRPTGHFLQRCEEREATLDDGLRVLKGGVPVPSHSEIHSRFGPTYLFRGIDTKDRKSAVAVAFDDIENILLLITIYPV